MYRQFTADDYRKHMELPTDYSVHGFIVYGTFRAYPYEQLRNSLTRLKFSAEFSNPEFEFLKPIQEFRVNGKLYWFVTAYGGAQLSEYTHIASLFGSKLNILLGSCGGLKKGANTREIIIPTWSYAEESSAKAYQPDTGNKYSPDESLSSQLAEKISKNYTVHRGPTVTYQAMMGETWEDVQRWAEQGYIGVEMEAATIFATSNYFKVPSAAVLRIGDNLIEEETVLDINYDQAVDMRRQVSEDIFDVVLAATLKRAD